MSDDVIGCGDSGCVFGRGPGTRYGGQHTNGGVVQAEHGRGLSMTDRWALAEQG